ncbi:hypothetical protein [Pseudomonas sp. AMR01]|uniref:hypothetical protein n=1 Tax=Pseudomonas sp. AMR01 TaxID=3064904 RepID=UPI0035C1DB8B
MSFLSFFASVLFQNDEYQLHGIYHPDTRCPLLFEEVDRFLELGLAVTLNLHYFADKDCIRESATPRALNMPRSTVTMNPPLLPL